MAPKEKDAGENAENEEDHVHQKIKAEQLHSRCGEWGRRQQPQKFDELDFHSNITTWLKMTVSKNNWSHMIFCGPPGSGKRTRVHALLRHLYPTEFNDADAQMLTHEGVTVPIIKSKYHSEVDLSSIGSKDRHIVDKLIVKEMGMTLETHVLVIYQANHLSMEAQSALRRTMETCVAFCKIILVCHDTAGIIQPIQGRCSRIRIPAPKTEEIEKVLSKAYELQGLGTLPQRSRELFAHGCDRDLTRAMWMLQASFAVSETKNLILLEEPWKEMVETITHIICTKDFSIKPKYGEKIPHEEVYEKLLELLKIVPAVTLLMQIRNSLLNKDMFKESNVSDRCDMIRLASLTAAAVSDSHEPILHLKSFCDHVIAQIFAQTKIKQNRLRVCEIKRMG